MYRCESWSVKKTGCWRIDVFELWCWRGCLRVPWTARRSNQSILKSTLNIHWKNWCWSCSPLAIWCEEPTHWKRPWCWERLRTGGEGGNREWDGWMASLIQWTWVWANSGRWWRTGKPGVLQSMGLQRVGLNLATEQHLCTADWLFSPSSVWYLREQSARKQSAYVFKSYVSETFKGSAQAPVG